MRTFLAPLLVLGCLVVAAIAQRTSLDERLPARVAVHFNAFGQVNQWANKADVISASAQAWRTVPMIVLGVALLVVLGVRYFPPDWINLPNKDYWLASPKRRWQAVAILLSFTLWASAGGVALGMALTEDLIWASFEQRGTVFGLPAVIGFVLWVFALIAWIFVRFSRVRPHEAPAEVNV